MKKAAQGVSGRNEGRLSNLPVKNVQYSDCHGKGFSAIPVCYSRQVEIARTIAFDNVVQFQKMLNTYAFRGYWLVWRGHQCEHHFGLHAGPLGGAIE